jgi:AraC-like DNA-binding protein
MPGNFLIAEEHRRLLCDFAASLAPDNVAAGRGPTNADRDPLQLRPIASVAPYIQTLLGIDSPIPVEWRFGEYLAANSSDLLTVRALRSESIGEALDVMREYQSILTNVRTISHRSRTNGDVADIHRGECLSDPIVRFLFHSFLASKLSHMFHLYSGNWRQAPVDMQADCFPVLMQRLAREVDFIDIDYRDGEVILGFSRDTLVHRPSGPNERLNAALDRELRRKVADVPEMETLSNRITFYIRSKHLSDVSVDEISEAFGVQRRTLARQLRDEGTTFTNILTEIRREKALHLVRHTNMPLKRVAAELGFNSDASFNMAFKSWTGTAPMKFRNNPSPQPPANDPRQTVFACRVMQQKSLIATYS